MRERGVALYPLAERDISVLDISYDSLLANPDDTPHGIRIVRFTAPDRNMSMTVTTVAHRDQVDALVLVRPTAAAVVGARYTDDQYLRATVDMFGAAQFATLPPGIVSFYAIPAGDGRQWRTAWLHY